MCGSEELTAVEAPDNGQNGWNMMRSCQWYAPVIGVVMLSLCAAQVQAEPLDGYNSALKFYEQKKWNLASDEFTDFLELAPTHPKAPLAQLYLGQSLTHAENYAEARAVFRKFLAAHPTHTDAALAAYRIGESSYFLKDYQAASTELETFVQDHPNHDLAVWGWQYLGETRLQLGDAPGAVQAFEVVLKLKTDVAEQVEAKFYLARAYEAMRQDDKAEALYREVSAVDHPRAAEALFGMASTEYQANRFEAAAQTFANLCTRFPSHSLVPTAELNGGFSLYQLSNFAGAEKRFAAAAQSAALSINASFWMGMCRKSQSDWAGAAQAFEALSSKIPPGEQAEKTWYHWADCESHLDHFDVAQKMFLALGEKWPDSKLADDSLYSAADAALRGKQVDDALRLTELFPTRYATSPLIPLNEMLRGRAFLARGDLAPPADLTEAQADFQRASELFLQVVATSTAPRTTAQARILLARAEKRLNRPEKVIEALNPLATAINAGEEGSAEYAEALPLLGEALLDLGQSSEAEAVLTQAIKNLPATSDRRPSTLMKVAEVQAALGKWTEMDATLDELARINTSGELLAQAAYTNVDRAIAKKEWKVAQQLLQRIVGLGDSSRYYVSALSELGAVQAEQGQHAAAAETYNTLLTSAATDTEVLSIAAYNRGICLEQAAGEDSTKLAAAAAALAEGARRFAIPADKTLPDAIEQKVAVQATKCARRAATLYAKLNQLDEADKLWHLAYDQIMKLQPADREQDRPDLLLYEWAVSLLNAGKTDRADAVFAMLYDTFPDSEFADDARLSVAKGHELAGRSPAARQLYQTLEADTTAAASTRQDALLSWMNLEAHVENWKESQRIAEVIVQTFGDSPAAFDARYRLGESQVQLGDFVAASTTLTALRADPTLPNANWKPQLELLWAESQLGLKEQDYTPLRATLETFLANPPTPLLADQAHEILGRLELKESHFAEAREHWKSVTNSKESAKSELSAKAQFAIAESFLAQKSYPEAIKAYNNLYVNYLFPEFQAPALLQMALCEMQTKEWARAKATLTSLIAEFPTSAQAQQASRELETVQKYLPASEAP